MDNWSHLMMSELRLSPEVQSELKNLSQSFHISPSEMIEVMIQHMKCWDNSLNYQSDPQLTVALDAVLEKYADTIHQGEILS